MKLFLTSLLATFLVACGTQEAELPVIEKEENPKSNNSDPYLSQYLEHFYGICLQTSAANRCKENYKKLISINFVDSFGEEIEKDNVLVAGVCWWSKNTRRVQLKRGLTESGSMKERGLIFHELGHCLLDLGHANASTKMMMNPYLFDEKTYADNWDKFQKELFGLVLSLLFVNEENLPEDKEIPIY